jgi:hypothetical protein
VRGNIYLSDSLQHSIKIRYFQGPKYQLALQLFWSLDGSPEKIFPGLDFVLYPPKPASRWWLWLLVALGIILLAVAIYRRQKKNSAHKPIPPSAPSPGQ